MEASYHRPTRILIDIKAIEQNIQSCLHYIGDKKMFVVVKADGYGHGAVETAKAALKAGAVGSCVATIDEGILLRKAGIAGPILILGIVDVRYVPILINYQLSITVSSLSWLQQAVKLLKDRERLFIHLKLDTGMGRIGFLNKQEFFQAVALTNAEKGLFLEGIFTHFATADDSDSRYWAEQNNRFKQFVEGLENVPPYIHSSNTASTLWHNSAAIGNTVRFGLGAYGLNPSNISRRLPFSLRPALQLVSKIVQVKQVSHANGIGYGTTYVTKKEEWIGTVPIGYGDGWTRNLQGFSVLVNDEYCPIVGRICMDQCMIRLSSFVPVGTPVTLIGKSKQEQILVEEVAKYAKTNSYEIPCLLSDRIPRYYF
ncbi:alanine racemase [Candidatus Enterococcus ferrettii]|uniref:Alanine racemase n=1 Tax=Candidatus Enterococcus ferrettii TaxID=2815324 RepID=A0ABV0EMH8_9ENTE|nr:alanine racemase [Enterococcus sp. 665A]MBO1339191.1 alanine racemase [Enterococcus sp. 665A]